jgi:hypothetical protein
MIGSFLTHVSGYRLAPRRPWHSRAGARVVAAGRRSSSRRSFSAVELTSSVLLLSTSAMYLHTRPRRGKFAVWADILADLQLLGDEHVVCMAAKLVPRGHVTGVDLWRMED